MSFILDALRKSEHERQRQAGPGLVELRPALVRPQLPVWAIALAALLAVNLAVLGVLMLRRNGSDAPAATAVPAQPAQSAATGTGPLPIDPTPASAMPPLNSDAPSAAAGSPATDAYVIAAPGASRSSSYTGGDAMAASQEAFAEDALAEPGPELQPPPRAGAEKAEESAAGLPTFDDVTFQGATVPELHLDIHVYATQPGDRFVFLNNRKYREGGETPDGTRIERITRDGVVLNHRGVRFLLPRQ
jgi:general secretion pathway protein B